ncbi:ATP-binding protein [Mycoplasmopsis fermentans]|nr:ATP-binding protein [Mycoplasmopsis fermentans]VEU66876.1 Chromosomal replication initiator protein dnaA [Mesomycoplasma conjunctivae]AAF15559.1 putative DNA helicase [Mycoplasmopsis fermentans]ADN68701.1 primosomal protein [Mycoplasmopsis fermentans JER]ADV34088.1 Putative primosomal DNA helicase DnaI [Mycoplasmopsis fermentans M64]VEU60116.1 Chromosomal replication initiator protein dnaA [Mycoplasmopsis fermentans]
MAAKEEIKNELFFNSKAEFENKALEIMHGHPQLEALIQANNITNEEILENLFTFINIKESLDNSQIYPWIFSISRKNEKLVFKKIAAKNEYKSVVTRHINLWLTQICEPNPEARLDRIRLSSAQRKEMFEYINHLKVAIAKKKQKGLKGIYVYGANNTGKTYIASAIANEFAAEGISSVYLTTSALYSFLISNMGSNATNANAVIDIINKLKKVNALIIDEIGLEKNNYWFRLQVLMEIIESRIANNKITFFFSGMNKKEFESYYHDQLKREPYKVKTFTSRILNNTLEFCIDEIEK